MSCTFGLYHQFYEKVDQFTEMKKNSTSQIFGPNFPLWPQIIQIIIKNSLLFFSLTVLCYFLHIIVFSKQSAISKELLSPTSFKFSQLVKSVMYIIHLLIALEFCPPEQLLMYYILYYVIVILTVYYFWELPAAALYCIYIFSYGQCRNHAKLISQFMTRINIKSTLNFGKWANKTVEVPLRLCARLV